MTKLTQEQLQTIENGFNSIPEPMRTGKFGTMEGIEEQLAEGSTLIFYMTKGEDKLDEDGETYNEYYNMKSMKVN